MFTWIWIFEIVFHGVVAQVLETPGARWAKNVTSCEEFERDAHFEPTEVIDAMWKIFYSWAETTELSLIVFSLLTMKRIKRIKAVVDSIDPGLGVQWLDVEFLMEPREGLQIVFLRQGTPGAYRALIIAEQRDKVRPLPPPVLHMADVRMKLVGRVMGMMSCEELTAYALARQHELPVTEADCAVRANTLGYRGPAGRSYLTVQRMIKHEL
ncbi:uncharacterized protein LOC125227008 [Leguminivora glycinivorella]|uniref:uncharacterized protein LOC125227008 n=1 Tax=Leguminivora glycinivorella TaxID=1035111 RepID=UPI00200FF8C7|nr:uncharacterized protein LOC125227008 [Leguminivora glycinivorella]